MRDDLVIRNFGDEAAYCAIQLAYGADFADLFEVKEGRVAAALGDDEYVCEHVGGAIGFRHKKGSHGKRGHSRRARSPGDRRAPSMPTWPPSR